MKKDYQLWTPIKKLRNNEISPTMFFHEREIWHCHVGENIGDEQDGKGEEFVRPILILRKFNARIFWGVPLTRTIKNLPFYFPFRIQDKKRPSSKKSSAILSQIRLMDAKRLIMPIGYISESDFADLKEKFKALLP